MASPFEDLVKGNCKSGYMESVKKAQSFSGTDYEKCQGCSKMTSKCPLAECFKAKRKKKK
jgi:hypothetical protein